MGYLFNKFRDHVSKKQTRLNIGFPLKVELLWSSTVLQAHFPSCFENDNPWFQRLDRVAPSQVKSRQRLCFCGKKNQQCAVWKRWERMHPNPGRLSFTPPSRIQHWQQKKETSKRRVALLTWFIFICLSSSVSSSALCLLGQSCKLSSYCTTSNKRWVSLAQKLVWSSLYKFDIYGLNLK